MAASYERTTSDDSFVFVESDVIQNRNLNLDELKTRKTSEDNSQLASPISNRTKPLDLQHFERFLDPDGRLVDESLLRKTVFLGGVDSTARKKVWQFLFGLYPYSSTKREREALLLDYIVKYHEMKSRWKTLLVLSAKPGASDFEKGLVARYQLKEPLPERSPEFETNTAIGSHQDSQEDITQQLAMMETKPAAPDFSTLLQDCETLDINSTETKQQIEFMKIQAKVFVSREKMDENALKASLRLIDKDVPRTDRDFEYFRGSQNKTLTMLREILITYSAFHSEIGYAQGMNDILARFLYVFDSEVEAYWCFQNYLNRIKQDFMETGMMNKIKTVRKLLQEMDEELLKHLEHHDLGDLIFCHRWLLLGFKREFSFMDSLRVFEILSSHHLELSSVEAEMARRRQQMKEFAIIGGVTRTTPADLETEYTFELFMCVALLLHSRQTLLSCTDVAMVFDCINNLKIDLDLILEKSEQLFFTYCKKTVEDSFLMIDTPSIS